MDEVKLLPCPFCGISMRASSCGRTTYHSHNNCTLDGWHFNIPSWNTRAIEATDLVPAAAAIVDIWMGGNTAWRSRLSDSDFLESADWLNALELARAAIEATRPTDMEVRDVKE